MFAKWAPRKPRLWVARPRRYQSVTTPYATGDLTFSLRPTPPTQAHTSPNLVAPIKSYHLYEITDDLPSYPDFPARFSLGEYESDGFNSSFIRHSYFFRTPGADFNSCSVAVISGWRLYWSVSVDMGLCMASKLSCTVHTVQETFSNENKLPWKAN